LADAKLRNFRLPYRLDKNLSN